MAVQGSSAPPQECECQVRLGVSKLACYIADIHGLTEDGRGACFKAFLLGLTFAAVAPEWAIHTYADVIAGLCAEFKIDPVTFRDNQRQFVREWTAKYPAGGRP